MSELLVIAIPSKGRLKEQAEAWLSDCGFRVEIDGGARGYTASLKGLPNAEVRLLSASDIATALDSGEIHLGVTGEDVIRERGGDIDARVMLLRALGFGRADLVVAAPQSWIDVDVMTDVAEVAHLYLARTGQRLRVATKYGVQTRDLLRPPRHRRLSDRRQRRRHRGRARRRSGRRADRGHHHHWRDALGQQPEDRLRRGDPEKRGAAGGGSLSAELVG